MTRRTGLAVLIGGALLASACGGDDDSTAADGSTSSVTTTGPTSSLVASTVSTVSSTTSDSTTTTADPAASTPSSSTTSTAATSSTSASTSTSEPAPTTVEVLVIDGEHHEFTSPSGNIACVMSATSVSCWIGEKTWTIDQPDGPDCEISDWGNAVELTLDGPTFPCYTDMAWNPLAPAMAYGNAVELGFFRCDSAETGVTCRVSSGPGFTVARASVRLF